MVEDLDERLARLVKEAHDLRFSGTRWDIMESPQQLHERLLETRANLDRLEEIVGQLILLKRGTAQGVARSQAGYDDAWAEASMKSAVSFTQEDAAPRERYAKYDAMSTAAKMGLRAAQAVTRDVEATLDTCQLYRWGLDGVRRDLDARIRLLTFERSLER